MLQGALRRFAARVFRVFTDNLRPLLVEEYFLSPVVAACLWVCIDAPRRIVPIPRLCRTTIGCTLFSAIVIFYEKHGVFCLA